MTAPQPLDPAILDAMNRITLWQLHNEGRCVAGCFVCATIVAENEPVCDGCAMCEAADNHHCADCCSLGQPF